MASKDLTKMTKAELLVHAAQLERDLAAARKAKPVTPALGRDIVLNWIRQNMADVAVDLRSIPGVLPEATAPTTDPAAPTAISPEQGQKWLEGLEFKDWLKAVKASASIRSGVTAKMIANF